jgi:hypothetical protein
MQRSVDILVAALSLSANGSDARVFSKLNRMGKDLNRSSSARLIAPISTPATVAVDPPLIVDLIRRDEVSSSSAPESDNFRLATPWWLARLGLSTATPPLAAACYDVR